MVSYYNPLAMYRQQTSSSMVGPGSSAANSNQFHHGNSSPSAAAAAAAAASGWYPAYQAGHQLAAQQQYLNCEDGVGTQGHHQHPTPWSHHHHHHHHPHHAHAPHLFTHQEWPAAPEFAAAAAASVAAVAGHASGSASIAGHHHGMILEDQLPSPPITVSSSELSSPGAIAGPSTPPQNMNNIGPRPAPVRSPYEWMKKPSYQSQPNPGKKKYNCPGNDL